MHEVLCALENTTITMRIMETLPYVDIECAFVASGVALTANGE